jgi:hypothetical protein
MRNHALVAVIALATLLAGCNGRDRNADPRTADSPRAEPQIVFFYQVGCFKCDDMKAVLNSLLKDAPNLTVAYHDMDSAPGRALLLDHHRRYGLSQLRASAPTIFVGRAVIAGAGRAQELRLAEAVEACAQGDCPSPLRFRSGD